MIAQQKALAVTSGSGLGKTQHGNSSEAQRRRLLAQLRNGSLSTIEVRRDLDIMMPAARIFELRALGHRIDTFRTHEPTECGRTHCVARYVLQTSEDQSMSQPAGLEAYRHRVEPHDAANEPG